MSEPPVFIDTNIFVYAKLENLKDAEKHRMSKDSLAALEQEAVISIQVINEFSTVLLKHGIEDKITRQAVKEMTDAAGCLLLH